MDKINTHQIRSTQLVCIKAGSEHDFVERQAILNYKEDNLIVNGFAHFRKCKWSLYELTWYNYCCVKYCT